MLFFLKILLFLLLIPVFLIFAILLIPTKINVVGERGEDSIDVLGRLFWVPWLLELRGRFSDGNVTLSLLLLGLTFPISSGGGEKPEKAAVTPGQKTGEKRKSSAKAESKKYGIAGWKAYYHRNREDLHKVLRRFFRMGKGILRHSFGLKIQELHILYGGEDPYAVHELQRRYLAVQPLIPSAISERASLRFRYDQKGIQGKINLFFYINLYSILFRFIVMLMQAIRIRRLVKDYGNT